MRQRVLVVAAHSDDEALGCAGTLRKYIMQGAFVKVCFLTNGVGARDASKDEITTRDIAASRALTSLGIEEWVGYDFPDNCLDTVPLIKIVKSIEELTKKFKPDLILTHHFSDLNIDHRRALEAVLVATRPEPGQSVKEIWSFEVLSSTEWSFSLSRCFQPNIFVDVSEYMDSKIEACLSYSEEFRPAPHSRSIEHVKALAAHRGFSVGVPYAEAFELVRSLK